LDGGVSAKIRSIAWRAELELPLLLIVATYVGMNSYQVAGIMKKVQGNKRSAV
jgi:hypothetical protein